MKLKKGDQVKIMTGKDAGKTGKVLTAFPAEDRVTVDGLNLVKKNTRPRRQGEKGQTVMVPRPLPVSRVQLICASCKNPTRVGYRVEGSAKVRYCKKCKATI